MEMLKKISPRPYLLPGGRWIMAQSWQDLLFVHWRLPTVELRAQIPSSL